MADFLSQFNVSTVGLSILPIHLGSQSILGISLMFCSIKCMDEFKHMNNTTNSVCNISLKTLLYIDTY